MNARRLLAPAALAALALAGCTSSTPPSGVTTASLESAEPTTAAATPSDDTSDEDTPEPTESAEPTATEPAEQELALFFSAGDGTDCAQVQEVSRTVPAGADALEESMALLLAGPTEEETAAGITTGFGETTAEALRHTYIEASIAYIDMVNFSEDHQNWSASCGSQQLLAQLDQTVEANAPTEVEICYSFDGELSPFYEWLQAVVPDHCDQVILDSILGG